MQRRLLIYLWGLLFLLAAVRSTYAATNCQFNTSSKVMALAGDCTTDSTILVPNGSTLDGGNLTITVVDPASGHFRGAVIKNGGTVANVVNVRITSAGLADVCDTGPDALRGILFDGASGTISRNSITNLNQGSSACLEGNAIEVRNDSTNGSIPAVQTVKITGNKVLAYQHSGIACDGYVNCLVRSNVVGESATQADQPTNSIQIRYGARAVVEKNDVSGNSWGGNTNNVSTAILLYYAADGTVVRRNKLTGGKADIGIYAYTDGAAVANNQLYKTGQNLNQAGWDVGIYVYSPSKKAEVTATNTVVNNKVRGYLYAFNSPELATR